MTNFNKHRIAQAGQLERRVMRLKKDREWREYPLGTKAHALNGGYWIMVKTGWKWCSGDTFPTPGGDAFGNCIELPNGA